ncbi:2-hydroxyacid dehydrogenase [Erwinia tracheiphila PSU-1]|nr:2-hydroxyacid dehydrogenase [Erwinia tracheiphila PSU-1]
MQDHPFWHHPTITITPHNAAVPLREDVPDAIARAIMQCEVGDQPGGRVDLGRGY